MTHSYPTRLSTDLSPPTPAPISRPFYTPRLPATWCSSSAPTRPTGETRYVICAVDRDDGDYALTPFGHLAPGNPYEAYVPPAGRSEEHTSELQSLMRISYAVFCLKKKRKKHTC